MRSYLSIDLDYWSKHQSDKQSLRFMKKVFNLGLPVFFVKDHEQLLPHLNAEKYDIVYNVDYHSDIFGFRDAADRETWYSKNKPECGNWSVFVDWRSTGIFHWMYPHAFCYTHDNDWRDSGVCWTGLKDNPYLGGVIKEWKELRKSKGVAQIDWGTIKAVGVCLSPDWVTPCSIVRAAALFGLSVSDVNQGKMENGWVDKKQSKKNYEAQMMLDKLDWEEDKANGGDIPPGLIDKDGHPKCQDGDIES